MGDNITSPDHRQKLKSDCSVTTPHSSYKRSYQSDNILQVNQKYFTGYIRETIDISLLQVDYRYSLCSRDNLQLDVSFIFILLAVTKTRRKYVNSRVVTFIKQSQVFFQFSCHEKMTLS